MKTSLFALAMLGLNTIYAQNIHETKLTASDGSKWDKLGYSVSISDNYAIVGARDDDDNGNGSGSAYIFKLDSSNWIEQSKLTASDGNKDDEFGGTVSISGDYVVIGAKGDDGHGSNSGSAYIFKCEGESWVEQAKLTASDAGRNAEFGISVSISGDYVIVGAKNDGNGSAYFFKRYGSSWVEQDKHTRSSRDYFGVSVSISGNYAIVGSYSDSDNGFGSGAAYIFKRDSTKWIEHAKLTASNATESALFGVSVSIDNERAIVGARNHHGDLWVSSGAAYIFERKNEDWNEQAILWAIGDRAEGDQFGHSVAISRDYAIVAVPYDDDNGYDSGSAYLYKREEENWIKQQKIIPSDGAKNDYFGYSVSISGNNAIVGAVLDDDSGNDSGSAYVYNVSTAVGIEFEPSSFPSRFSLEQNYPNPFNTSTTIRYTLVNAGHVSLKVFDIAGREVASLVDNKQKAGEYAIHWHPRNMPSGVYIYCLQTGKSVGIKKLILLK